MRHVMIGRANLPGYYRSIVSSRTTRAKGERICLMTQTSHLIPGMVTRPMVSHSPLMDSRSSRAPMARLRKDLMANHNPLTFSHRVLTFSHSPLMALPTSNRDMITLHHKSHRY